MTLAHTVAVLSQEIRTIADVDHIDDVPIDVIAFPRTTYDVLADAASRYGDRSALTYLQDGEMLDRAIVYSFSDLLSAVTRTANAFHALGIGKDDVVAYALPNLPQAHFALWGAEAAGIALALNPMLAPEQTAALLQAANARVLVTLPHLWAMFKPHVAGLTAVLLVGGEDVPQSEPRLLDFDRALAAQSSDGLVGSRVIAPDDFSSWFCTGGTTGTPKIAMRTHLSETSNAAMCVAARDTRAKPRTYFCALPLYHVNGPMTTGLIPWMQGEHVVLGPPMGYRDPSVIPNFWRIVEHFHLTSFSAVPTVLGALVKVPLDGADISSLESVACGTAPMPSALFERFEQATGVPIIEGYGLTEGACVSTMNPIAGERRIGSIGLRLPWQRLRTVVLASDGSYIRDCAVGEIGALAISGPNLFAGYRNPTHNEAIWLDIEPGSRWLNTGDLARIDSDGYVWLTGRIKELIIRGGHNIDPATIEEPLYRHPAVALAAAVPRPDAHAGEVPVAYVQLNEGATASEDDLLTYIAGVISEKAATPKAIRIIDAIPLTPVGKVFKPALKDREIEDVIRTEAAIAGVSVEIAFFQDATLGRAARIESAGDIVQLTAALGRYTFNYRLTGRL